MRKYMYVLVGMLIFLSACTTSESDHHADTEGKISPETLSERLDDYIVIDIRSVQEFEEGHIKGSYSIPIEEISEKTLRSVSQNKESKVVLYGNSDISASRVKTLLEVMGYHEVNILNGGLVHWNEDGLEVEEGKSDSIIVAELPKKSDISISPEDYDFGSIKRTGGVVKKDFLLRNSGENKIEIEETSTSCGCTTAELSSDKLIPGGEVTLTVVFDPDFHKEPQGKFTRTVFLLTSEGIELQIKIHVEIIEA